MKNMLEENCVRYKNCKKQPGNLNRRYDDIDGKNF